MYTEKEFIEKSRKKFPEFQKMSDSQVLSTMLERYPVYKDQIQWKWFFEKTYDYWKEVAGKIAEWVDNAVTDVSNLSNKLVNKVTWIESEDIKPARHMLWIKDESDYQWWLIKNIADQWSKAADLVTQSVNSAIENPTLGNIWQQLYNVAWATLWGVWAMAWEAVTSWFDTVVSDQTQEDTYHNH